jgi:hypothetical protein
MAYGWKSQILMYFISNISLEMQHYKEGKYKSGNASLLVTFFTDKLWVVELCDSHLPMFMFSRPLYKSAGRLVLGP